MATPIGTPMSKITIPAASIIPQGVGAPPPPGLDPKKGKLMCIKVRMLDDTVGVFHLGHKAVGQALFDEVCRHLNLLECDYFGLEFLDCFVNRCWLDKEKSILKQITLARSDARFYFVVKFYTPTPADLEEEYTRYLFALQIKRDLATGEFVCNENTAALMASYIVQSECGDFSSDDYHDHSYLSSVRFVPNQSAEFEKKVMENHKKLTGMGPAESDLALLETARRSEFYGVKFHAARDIEGTPVSLAVLHLGIKVYHHLSCASTFSWAKLRKLSFKRRKLLIKLLPESCAYYKDMIEFSFETRNECKMFWKKAIEHHAFFRCPEVLPTMRHQSKFFTKGSSFRYTGRTQQQLIDYVREHHKRREPFTRPLHSSKMKRVDDDRLLPTPVSSLPGTLVRENGNVSRNVAPAIRIDFQEDRGTFVVDAPVLFEQNYRQHSNGHQEEIFEDEIKLQLLSNNNEEGEAPPLTTIIPPTPDTPQLKRKVVKTAAAPTTRQQITFHFPVTEISPDSPSSTYDFGGVTDKSVAGGDQSLDEWAAPPASLPPLSPGAEGEGIEEDNVSEDSYHLAEHEEIAFQIHQQSVGEFISTGLPSIQRGDAFHECTCVDELRLPTSALFGDQPAASMSSDAVSNSNLSKSQLEKQSDHVASGEIRSPLSPRCGIKTQPPKAVAAESCVATRTKPVPPPKPKMGLVQLERSARGDYGTSIVSGSSVSQSASSIEPVVISQSTVTTKEVTVKRMFTNEPVQVDNVLEAGEKDETRQSAGTKKEDFAVRGASTSVESDKAVQEGSAAVGSCASIGVRVTRSPPTIPATVFPSDSDSVSSLSAPQPPPASVPVIEVQSEECPEIRHKIVNGDIPYILHVRHVKKDSQQPSAVGSTTFSTFKDVQTTKPFPQPTDKAFDRAKQQISSTPASSSDRRAAIGRRKSFDLVPRKRLPSPASFSSQDHSVSPDSEHDVAGFVSKFRGHPAKKSGSQSDVLISQRQRIDSKRTDPRRLTQPIQPKPVVSKPKPARSQPCVSGTGNDNEDDDESGDEFFGAEAPSLHEGMDILETLDDVDRISVETAEMRREVESQSSASLSTVPKDAPFIDERESSESVGTDYDNLPPVAPKGALR